MTKEELEKTHSDYERYKEDWDFFVRSYFGGKRYREGNYLLQHPFESAANYKRRKKSAYFYNYCAPVVDIFVSHLFKDPPKRDYGSLDSDYQNPQSLFNQFWYDCDFEGSDFREFMREAARLAAIFGRVSVVVDKPDISPSTKAEAVSLGIRPYLALVTPNNLMDWRYVRSGGKSVLSFVKILESKGISAEGKAVSEYRIWTEFSWQLWRITGIDVALAASGDHNLGKVPIVNLYNKKSLTRMVGISDLEDIADINKNIYFLCSDAKEIIENTAFPMLALPYEKSGPETTEVGPKNIIQFDPDSPARPFWLEAPHTSLTEIREWVSQDIDQINRIARTGGATKIQESVQPRSGVALEIEFQHLYAALREKADNAEQAESEIFKLYALWEGTIFDGSIDYPDEFNIKDVDRDLNRFLQAEPFIKTPLFKIEVEKKTVDFLLPRLDENKRNEIFAEIENAKMEEGENDRDGVDAGSPASVMAGGEADDGAPV